MSHLGSEMANHIFFYKKKQDGVKLVINVEYFGLSNWPAFNVPTFSHTTDSTF